MTTPSDKEDHTQRVDRLLRQIEEAIRELDHVNAIFWVLGLSMDGCPSIPQFFATLCQRHREMTGIRDLLQQGPQGGKRPVLANLDDMAEGFGAILRTTRDLRRDWEERGVGIRCSFEELVALINRIKTEGQISLPKKEVDPLLDLSPALPFWKSLPDYTLVILGNGVSVSLPESDLFESMCWFNDEALSSRDELKRLRPADDEEVDELRIQEYQEQLARHGLMCRETLLSAFVLLEAYINSVAHVFLESDSSNTLTEEELLYLQEREKKDDGKERTKFVSLTDKVVDWVRLMSPRGETLDKGRAPFQDFRVLKRHRDAMVHLAAPKVETFRQIDIDLAKKSAKTVCAMISEIARCVSQDGLNRTDPFWLSFPKKDGRFRCQLRKPVDVSHLLK